MRIPKKSMGEYDHFRIAPQTVNQDSRCVSPIPSSTDSTESSSGFKNACNHIIHFLRPGFLLDHLDKASFRIASRTFIQFVVSLILNTIVPVNNWFGGSAYLLNVANIWDPPGGYSMAAGVLLAFINFLSVCVSVIFFLVIDAITWKVGGSLTIHDVYLDVIDQCAYGDELCMREAILDGRYLSIEKTTIGIFGIIICLTWHYYISSSKPYLRCAWLFGMVSALILIPESLHYPYWDPWHKVKSVVRCLGVAVAIKSILCLIYFPVTSSYKLASFMEKTLGNLQKSARDNFQNECLQPSDPTFRKNVYSLGPGIERFLLKFSLYELDFVLSRYEISYSRFECEDLHELRRHCTNLGNILRNYHFVYSEFMDSATSERAYSNDKMERPNLSRGFSTNPAFDYRIREDKHRKLCKKYLDSGNFELTRHTEYLENEKILRPKSTQAVDNLFHDISKRYSPLNEACTVALGVLQDWVQAANSFRWSLCTSTHQEHVRRQEEINLRLRLALDSMTRVYELVNDDNEWLLSLCSSIPSKGTQTYVVSQALYYGFICKEYVRNVRVVAGWCLNIDKQRPLPAWKWYRLAGRHSATLKRNYTESTIEGLDFEADSEPYVPLKSQVRDPECTPPRNFFHVFTRSIRRLAISYCNPRLMYSLKVGCTAIIPLIPFFVRTSLHWVHSNRGIWAAITCMMSASPRASDSVFGLLCRLGATCCGAVIGIVCWYIAAGSDGEGNPYALAVTMSFVGVFLAYFRHFNMVGGTIMSIVLMLTIILVTMGSYSAKHNEEVMYTLRQSGATLALYRLVALSVGIVIAFISTIFPSFSTTKKAVRRTLGATLFKIGELQADLVNFIYQRRDNPKVSHSMFKNTLSVRMSSGLSTLSSTRKDLNMLVYEPPLTGKWPKYEYNLLTQLEEELIRLSSLYYCLFSRLQNTQEATQLLRSIGWCSNSLLARLSSSFFMAAHAIKTPSPLPAITTGNVCEWYQTHEQEMLADKSIESLISSPDGKIELIAMALSELYYQRVDGAMMIVKTLVGEYAAMDPRVWEDQM